MFKVMTVIMHLVTTVHGLWKLLRAKSQWMEGKDYEVLVVHILEECHLKVCLGFLKMCIKNSKERTKTIFKEIYSIH